MTHRIRRALLIGELTQLRVRSALNGAAFYASSILAAGFAGLTPGTFLPGRNRTDLVLTVAAYMLFLAVLIAWVRIECSREQGARRGRRLRP